MPSASSRSSSASITSAGEICSAPGASARVSTPDSRQAATVWPGSDGIVGDGGGRQLHGSQDARRADLADQRVRGERRQRVRQLRLELPGSFAQPLALHDVQVGERGGGRRRVSRVGVAVTPDAGALRPERLGDPRSRDRRAHRQVAAGDALRARDDVGLELPAPAREPRAAAAEPRDDLVRDEQHAGLAAHGAGGRQVAVGSRDTRRPRRSPARRRTPRPCPRRPARSSSAGRRRRPIAPARRPRSARRGRPRSPGCRRGSSPRCACRGTRARGGSGSSARAAPRAARTGAPSSSRCRSSRSRRSSGTRGCR